MFAYVTSDFSVWAVAENSHTAKPLIYKISGVWGNHEGSMIPVAADSWNLFCSHRDDAADRQTKPMPNSARERLACRR
jgi:cytochrome c-type biogenesis protein CcmF